MRLNKTTLSLVLPVIALIMVSSSYAINQVLPYRFGWQRHQPATEADGNFDDQDLIGEFHGEAFQSPFVKASYALDILGSHDPNVEKKIEVDLSKQKLYALENGQVIAEFNVSTGLWGRTPTGTFTIWTKLKSTKMEGGSKALNTYYYLPNVPFTMFFYNDQVPMHRGFGIHGTYWHSNFGQPMSHGCINMRTRDVERLYHWALPDTGGKNSIRATPDNPGTIVEIYGQAPES